MYLSPYVEEPLNSNVIKSFVPELRSRYVFFEFRDSYVLSLWTFDVRFTHSHIMAMVQDFPNERPAYDIKQTDGEVPVRLELWEIWCKPLLPLLPGPLKPRVITSRVLSMFKLN